MRIVGGTYRGKKLQTPTDDQTRPTSDKAREALFNILDSQLLKSGQKWGQLTFLDVFAGTGAVGIEALSRGAKEAFFIENHGPAIACLKTNTAAFQNAALLTCNAETPPFRTVPVDIIFMDAPYARQLWEKALTALLKAGWIGPQTRIIVEVERKEDILMPPGFHITDDRHYGRNRLLFCEPLTNKAGKRTRPRQ